MISVNVDRGNIQGAMNVFIKQLFLLYTLSDNNTGSPMQICTENSSSFQQYLQDDWNNNIMYCVSCGEFWIIDSDNCVGEVTCN